MNRDNRIPFFLIFLMFWLGATSFGVENPQIADTVDKQIEVRISPKTNVVRVGSALDVQVEIWNVGREQLFIEKDIYNLCFHSPLSLFLELGPPLKPREGGGCASDCLDDPNKSFTTRFVQRWISVPVGYFYGTTVHMGPDIFPQLQTPGRWQLRGTYKSEGDLSSSLCMNQVLLDPEQTGKLPYKGWKGEEGSNVVWIQVVEYGKTGKKR